MQPRASLGIPRRRASPPLARRTRGFVHLLLALLAVPLVRAWVGYKGRARALGPRASSLAAARWRSDQAASVTAVKAGPKASDRGQFLVIPRRPIRSDFKLKLCLMTVLVGNGQSGASTALRHIVPSVSLSLRPLPPRQIRFIDSNKGRFSALYSLPLPETPSPHPLYFPLFLRVSPSFWDSPPLSPIRALSSGLSQAPTFSEPPPPPASQSPPLLKHDTHTRAHIHART